MYKIIFAIMIICLVAGCKTAPNSAVQKEATKRAIKSFPKGSTNIKQRGANWVTFDWGGSTFLFYKEKKCVHASAYHGYAALAKIND